MRDGIYHEKTLLSSYIGHIIKTVTNNKKWNCFSNKKHFYGSQNNNRGSLEKTENCFSTDRSLMKITSEITCISRFTYWCTILNYCRVKWIIFDETSEYNQHCLFEDDDDTFISIFLIRGEWNYQTATTTRFHSAKSLIRWLTKHRQLEFWVKYFPLFFGHHQ